MQLPREFTLLIKTGCFGALYFSLLDETHQRRLFKQLLVAGAAYATSNPKARHAFKAFSSSLGDI